MLLRAAEPEIVRDVRDTRHNLVVDPPLREDARPTYACLSGVHEGADRWQRLAAKVTGLGVESALALPLLTGDQLIGSINCYARDRDAFGHREAQLGMTFAHAATVSLDTARLQREGPQRTANLRAAGFADRRN